MKFLILLLTLLPFHAQASTQCLRLLLEPAPSLDASPSERTAAAEWLKRLTNGAPYEGLLASPEFHNFLLAQKQTWETLSEDAREASTTAFVLAYWRRWAQITDGQRDLARTLEMKKLLPDTRPTIEPLSDIAGVSAENKARMLARLTQTLPLPANSEVTTWMVRATNDINFYYLSSRGITKETGVAEPIMSPRELKRVGIAEGESFYSSLVGGSAAVAFELVAGGESPYNLGAVNAHDQLNLRRDVAAKHGLVVPHIATATGLLLFLRTHDPEAMEQLSPARLASATKRLGHFVMTVPDAQDFLRAAFRHWLQYQTANYGSSEILHELRIPGGLQFVLKQFMTAIGMHQGFSVLVPVGVSPREYSILTSDGLRYLP